MSTPYREEIIGDARLILGDCREVLPTLDGVGAIVVDPPYGISHSSAPGTSRIKGNASWAGQKIANDCDTALRDFVLAWRGCRPAACFGTWKCQPYGRPRGCLVWDKGPAFGMGDLSFPWKPSFELIHVYGHGWRGSRDQAVLRGPAQVTWENAPGVADEDRRRHPHQKPAWLYERVIEKLPPDLTICDPTMGSGTAGAACASLGRRFVGIESEPRYFDISCRRIEVAHRQSDLFVERPAAKSEQATFDLRPEGSP